MLFSFVLSGGTALEAKANGETYMGPQINEDGTVTFYYQGDGTETGVYVKGSWNWDDASKYLQMAKGENNVWSVNSGDMLKKGQAYEYGICVNTAESNDKWIGDSTNPTNGGNAKILSNPNVDVDGNVTLYYYPDHGSAYPADMKVQYRKSGSADAYEEVAMSKDTTYTAALSAKLTGLTTGTYEYKFVNAGAEVADKLISTDTQTVEIVKYPPQDPNVVSPVIEGSAVTFHFYGPDKKSVQLAGSMTGWADGAKNMTLDESTGYWSITQNLSPGAYEYKFVVDGSNWITDPLNTNIVNTNSAFTIAPQTDDKSPVVNNWGTTFNYYAPDAQSVYVAGSMNGWSGTADAMLKDKAGWWTITLPLAEGDYEYKFAVDGSSDWITDPLNSNTSNGNSAVSVAKQGISPVVNGTSVTFVYKEDPKVSEKVRLAGDLTTPQWAESQEEFTYNTTKAQWEYTKTVAPGSYAYKFIKDADGWMLDPENSNTTADGNSKLLVAGLTDAALQAKKGVATALPETVKYYAGDETEHQVKVEYSVPETVKGVTISDGKITVDQSFTGESIPVTMKAGNFKATLNVTVVEAIYNYTIYYYDRNTEHQNTNAADLWFWEENGAPGVAHDFTETEVLADGKTWLKTTISASYTDLGMIARSKGEWSWQGPNVYYTNTDKKENVTLYLVADDATAYTELPEIKEVKDRYAMIEYVRSAGDYDNWSLYTWDSGFGSEVSIELTQINGKQFFIVPIKSKTKSLSFVVRRSEPGNDWAEKDGGDNNIATPIEQSLIKSVYTQGEGITYTYPVNMGYKLDTKNSRVGFFYRDDELALNDSLKTLEGKVKVEIDGKEFAMTYDAKTDRFVYYYDSLTEGDHYYRYLVNGEYKLDAYNNRTEMKESLTKSLEEYSVYTYKKYAAAATAEFSQKTVDYTQNSVLKVNVSKVDDMEVSSAMADISALGGSSQFAIDPQLMAGTVAVNENVKAGTYTIPVIVKDQYENEYSTSANITVTKKTGSDFDWQEAIIYFMVTDRFNDGNTLNNAGVEKDNPSGYHGGDFAGVTQKLDYLKDLGINTIWITPIVDNIDDALTTEVAGVTSHGYHGYWAKDFTTLDPSLGTEAELKTLISEAHSRGIKIMVDVVVNHAGYNTDFGDMIRSGSETVTGDAQLDSLSGLPDFATERPEVREKLIAWQTAWIKNYDIDYFRVDTVKHVEDTTWKAFKNSLTEVNPEFKMIGEYAGAGYTFDGGQLGTGQMDSLLDFDFNDFGQRFVTGNISQVEKSLEERNQVIDNTATLGNFLSSHDEDGLVYKLINENGMTEEEALNKMMSAATLQITAKGQPVIYYGEEIGMYGANNYPYQTNRYDFDWSKTTEDNKILNHYKKLLEARNTYSDVFSKGERVNLASSDEEGYLVFDRVYQGQHVIMAVNITDEAKTVTFDLTKKAADEVYTNLITAGYWKGSQINGTSVTITIPPTSEGGTYMFEYSENKADEEKPEDDGNDGNDGNDAIPEEKPEDNTTDEDVKDDTDNTTDEDVEDDTDNATEEKPNTNLENTVIKTGDATEAAGIILIGFAAAVVMADVKRRRKYC